MIDNASTTRVVVVLIHVMMAALEPNSGNRVGITIVDLRESKLALLVTAVNQ